SCGLYLDEDLTVPIETVYPSGVYDIPEGVNVYTKEATLDKLEFKPTGGTCSIEGSDQVTGEVVIPKTYYDEESGEEIPVTKIEASAFAESYMTSLITPDGLLEIGADALKNCPDVTYVKIPDTLTTLGNGAFFGCTKLESIDLSETTITSIGGQAFQQCESMTEVKLPETVTSIGRYAFADCKSLTEFVVPENVTNIGPYGTFSGCTSLESITLPEKVNNSSWERMFNGCTSLKELTIPEGIREFGAYVVWNNTALETLNLPSTLTAQIGSYNLSGLPNIDTITVASGNTSYKVEAGCLIYKETLVRKGTNNSRLQDVTSPITEVTGFGGLNKLTEILIPEGVLTSSGMNGLPNLITLSFPSTLTSFTWTKNNPKLENVIFAEGIKITEIPAGAFENCESLKQISIPEGVESIGGDAFYRCTSLESINLPTTLTSLSGCFVRCSSLKVLNIPGSIETYNQGQNFHSVYLDKLIFNEGTKYLKGTNTFWYGGIKSLYLSSTIESIDANFFWIGSMENVFIKSTYLYNASTDGTENDNLMKKAKKIYILSSIVENTENSSAYLNETNFDIVANGYTDEEGNSYYVYTRK
ncbi:MAG: leucine-rich repeat domain-containing protein, partial [Clostridiales bacterium]|nr:leucine-rich repeat domain-containing protein [Clostridiales bacterium]